MTHATPRTKTKRLTKAEKIRRAERTRDDLSEALRALGIVLPSLSVDAMAYGDEDPSPLIDLGRCNQPTARKLLAALRNPARTGGPAESQAAHAAGDAEPDGQ